MTLTDIENRPGLPPEMQTLLRDLPRDGWPDHPHFARSIRNWMGAHHGFRQIATLLESDTQAFLDRRLDDHAYADRLADLGALLLRNLHGHHTWEDRSFFPELRAADPRFDTGLDMLEADHMALDALLDRLGRQGNRVVHLATLDPTQMTDAAAAVLGSVTQLGGLLDRHLSDEEDLAVPILLHHGLRG